MGHEDSNTPTEKSNYYTNTHAKRNVKENDVVKTKCKLAKLVIKATLPRLALKKKKKTALVGLY